MSTTPFSRPQRAFLRDVSASFEQALREVPAPIDVGRARAQHRAYAAALRGAGVEVLMLPPDDACPDACFVEDVLIAQEGAIWSTTPGALARRAEVGPVAAFVGARPLGAVLDGGDVLRIGDVLYVGLSARTAPEAVGELAAATGLAAVPVAVQGGLHLKSAVTLLRPPGARGERAVVVALRGVDLSALRDVEIERVETLAGANVLALGEQVVVSAAAPEVAEVARARGLEAVVVDISEFHVADGALTCLSVRVARRGAWCC